MTALEKQIRDELKTHDYFYDDNMIKCISAYIEEVNANAPDDVEAYTPKDWLNDTKSNEPYMLIKRHAVMKTAVRELQVQRSACKEQTGVEPELDAYLANVETEDFQEKLAHPVLFIEIFNYMLETYVI